MKQIWIALLFLGFVGEAFSQSHYCEFTCSEDCREILREWDRVQKAYVQYCGDYGKSENDRPEVLCLPAGQNTYAPFLKKKEERGFIKLGGNFHNEDQCRLTVSNSKNGILCLSMPRGYAIYRIEGMAKLGNEFTPFNQCLWTVQRTRRGLVCAKTDFGYAPVEIETGSIVGGPTPSLEHCVSFLR